MTMEDQPREEREQLWGEILQRSGDNPPDSENVCEMCAKVLDMQTICAV